MIPQVRHQCPQVVEQWRGFTNPNANKVVPGDARPAFEHGAQARQILNDAEEDLREWQPSLEPVPSAATGMGTNLMPTSATEGTSTATHSVAGADDVSSPIQSPQKLRDVSGSTAVQAEEGSDFQRQ